MKPTNPTCHSAADLAAELGIHRTSVFRLMRRAGLNGLKTGPNKQHPRRYSESERQRLITWMRHQASQYAAKPKALKKQKIS